ncbi:Dam family site-specific DNA-(adenine-N6)-methyltransferase [Spiroplasma endosymbiont of Amphibalanus improvisus]|uniref:DNA adenine methylase n=1 Tax=Spiroplasma endosymbiont of Amphibalanus improvisus TaxID=3066327 RepID=UPI00313DFF02
MNKNINKVIKDDESIYPIIIKNKDIDLQLKPFLKWPGGKRNISKHIYDSMPKNFNNFIEPFVGAGSVFMGYFSDLNLNNNFEKKILINDINSELINVYNCIRKDYKKLICEINKINDDFMLDPKNKFYEIRQWDRDETFKEIDVFKKAARTIFLNKTCFNGLFRVNSDGYFNTPWNGKIKVNFYDIKNLKNISNFLKKVNILNKDFNDIINYVSKGDFIYFDPPYDVLNKNTFTSYDKTGFNRDDQKKLADMFKKLDKMGCFVMMSNHNTEFIQNLYEQFNFKYIKASRNVNSDGSKRSKVTELIITNYKLEKN